MSFQYTSNTTLDDVARTLRDATRVLITTHAKPDGDAFGSIIALGAALESTGRNVERWVMPPLASPLKLLADGAKLHYHADDSNPWPEGEPDRIVIVDTGSWAQLEPMRAWLEPRRDRTVIVDHHLHGNDVAALRYVDTSAAAACEIVADLIDALGAPFNDTIRRALYAGIATDTGWFRFSNTTARTHRLAARLIEEGVDHAAIYRAIEQGERPQKLTLLNRALASLEVVAGGRAAVMTLRAADFSESGARPEETERFVDIPQVVGDIEVVVLVVEAKGGRLTRLSFRSKPGPDAIDVNRLASRFGGGGHARAAGAKVEGPIADVAPRLREALEETLNSD